MQDRYGAMPEPVQLLVTAGRLRLLCEQDGVAQMDRKGQMVSVRFTETANIDPEKLMQLVARNAKRGAQFTPQGVLRFPVKATVPAEVLAELRRLIDALATPLPVAPLGERSRQSAGALIIALQREPTHPYSPSEYATGFDCPGCFQS